MSLRTCAICAWPIYDPFSRRETVMAITLATNDEPPSPIGGRGKEGEVLCVPCFQEYNRLHQKEVNRD